MTRLNVTVRAPNPKNAAAELKKRGLAPKLGQVSSQIELTLTGDADIRAFTAFADDHPDTIDVTLEAEPEQAA